MSSPGTLYGLGVGPGDPELITLKALRLLRACPVVVFALPRGSVLRVAYDWEDDVLVRFHWSVMDRTSATPPIRSSAKTPCWQR